MTDSILPNRLPAAASVASRILVVDDDLVVVELQRRILERAGYQVVVASTTELAYQQLTHAAVDLILLDYQLAENTNGIEFCQQVSDDIGRLPPVILVTGFASEQVLADAMRLGIRDFIPKTSDYLNQIPDAVKTLLDKVHIEQRLELTEARLVAMVRASQDAILLIELNGQISFANLAAERLFAVPLQQLIGQTLTSLLKADSNDENTIEVGWQQWLQQFDSNLLRVETTVPQGDQDAIPVELSLYRIDAGEKHFFCANLRDVTERTQLEQELQQAREREQQSKEMSQVSDLASRTDAAITASVMGVRPVHQAYPDIFNSLKTSYGELLEEGLNQRIFKVELDIQGRCRILASRLGFLKAGPRDVIELHTEVLKSLMAPRVIKYY